MSKKEFVSSYIRQARGMQRMAIRLTRWGRTRDAAVYREMARDFVVMARDAKRLMA